MGVYQERKEYFAKHRRENPELYRSYRKKHYNKHKHRLLEATRAWRRKNRERHNANIRRWRMLNPKRNKEIKRTSWRTCFIRQMSKQSGEPFESIVKRIDALPECCEICGWTPTKKRRIVPLDHCHETGHFRGKLCDKCNSGIGYFYNNTELLKKAVKYLKRSKRKSSK